MENGCNWSLSSNLSSGPQNYGGCSTPRVRQGYEEVTKHHEQEPRYTWQEKNQSAT